MSLLAQVDSVKAEALATLAAAADLPALEQAKGAFLGAEIHALQYFNRRMATLTEHLVTTHDPGGCKHQQQYHRQCNGHLPHAASIGIHRSR